jgi:hypothetical protein
MLMQNVSSAQYKFSFGMIDAGETFEVDDQEGTRVLGMYPQAFKAMEPLKIKKTEKTEVEPVEPKAIIAPVQLPDRSAPVSKTKVITKRDDSITQSAGETKNS